MGEKLNQYICEGAGAPEFKVNKQGDYSAYQWRSFDEYPGKVFFAGINAETLGLVVGFKKEHLMNEEIERLIKGKIVEIDCQDWDILIDRFLIGGLCH